AIGLLTGLKHLPNFLSQDLVELFSLADRTLQPGVVATARHPQHPAHPREWVFMPMGRYELILHRCSCENSFTAFFRISRSSSKIAFSRLSRRISASSSLTLAFTAPFSSAELCP